MHEPYLPSPKKQYNTNQSMDYFIEIITIIFSFLFLMCFLFGNKNNGLPTNWPLVGMLPTLILNFRNIHDYIVANIENFQLTFHFNGPWLSNMRLLVTVDPANVQHVMCKKFDNYPKGSKFREIFDIFGNSIITTDGDLWEYHRKLATTFLCHPKFNKLMVKKVWEKVENGVIPILDHVSKNGLEIDLQDLFERLTHDIISTLVVGYDPRSLSLDFPSVPFAKALDVVQQVFFYRHVVPTYIWKLQRWFGVGQEKKYKNACKIIDNFMFEHINSKKSSKGDSEEGVDLLTLYMEGRESVELDSKWVDDKFLRDIASSVSVWFLAGRDTNSSTLSWFFYLLTKNPQVISKIKEEIASFTMHIDDEKERYSYLYQNFEEYIDKLIYLHGALCEALRLYPPVTFEAMSPVEPDILPSGHQVDPNTQIIFDLFAMGRVKSIWGDDCNEFKPERWILENGKIKHEPSYKFFSFNAGPRACLGKNIAFFQIKVIAIAIIQNFHIQPVAEHQVTPDFSIIFRMKHGFKVRVHAVSNF